MEAHTRGQEHRVGERGELDIALILQAHFAAEFQEEVHEGERHEVQARAVLEGQRLAVFERNHHARGGIPAHGESLLHKVHGERETGTEGPAVSRIRVRVIFAVQVPGVPRGNAGLGFTRRGIGVEQQGKAPYAARIERGAHLGVDVQVATAHGPHVQGTRGAIRGMVVIERHAQAQVQEVQDTDRHEEVARKSEGVIVKGMTTTIYIVKTATGKGPGICGGRTAGTHDHVPLAERLRVDLAQALGAAGHNAGMGAGQARNHKGGG